MTLYTICSVVTDEQTKFEKRLVEVQDFRNLSHHSGEISRIYPNLIEKNQKMSTRNQLDLESLGFCPTMPKKTLQTLCHTLLQLSQTSWESALQVRN